LDDDKECENILSKYKQLLMTDVYFSKTVLILTFVALYVVYLQTYLTEFLQSLSQQPYYSNFSSHHTATERQVLNNINIAA